ncbi:phage holin family protein [Novosphingobium sp. Chol11]|uniref:phage holin family protein n=1 Tax=Novosphingobium sp. Chol11 TaxID=1385763 RepID=UPI0025F7E177|nr:phage holin family protein [Novosphingobium sp. Chol11]
MQSAKDSQATDHQSSEEPLASQVRGLIADGQALVEAELEFQKSRIAYALGQAKSIAVLLLLALALGFFALMALIVGLLLALAPMLGAWGALGAVVLGICAVAGLCVAVALRGLNQARAVLLGKPSAQKDSV